VKWAILALLLATIQEDMVHEVSEDGEFFRLHNIGSQAYYCWIEAPGGPYERMMYAGKYSPWYRLEQFVSWECEG
jgi:hypothetical protein